MAPRRIGRHIGGGPGSGPGADGSLWEALRDALAGWPAGVTIVAVRTDDGVHALTVSAFMPVSLDPPTILVSLGPNASAAPYLDPGDEFGVSLLAADQRGLASRYADTLPVGADPFPPGGTPLVGDALAGLVCVVEEILVRGDHSLVIGAVREVRTGRAAPALVWRHREYRSVD